MELGSPQANAGFGARKVTAVSNADTSLILRCQDNDAAAFNEIVARYKNRVYNYICRTVGPGADADDLTQETFIRAYMNIKSFQSRATLNTWLFRIATNICIDHQRKVKRIQSNLVPLQREDADNEEDVQMDIPDTRYNPEDMLLTKELNTELSKALLDLPEKLRTVILLHDIEGLAYEEIMEIVDCPLGTVKSRLFNARQTIRKKISHYLNSSV